MEQIIYADILFLIDISMDFLALYLSAYLLKVRFKVKSVLLGAIIGAVFSTLSVIMRSESIIASLVVSVIMCFIAFAGNGIFIKLKSLPVFYAVNMLLGGVMTALFNLFNIFTKGERQLLIFGQLNTVSSNMPLAVFYIGFFAILIIIAVFKKLFVSLPVHRSLDLTVKIGKNTKHFNVIEDSGNKVCEPISGDPIIFLKEKAINELAGEKVTSALKMGSEFYSGKNKQRYRIVIYKTVSGNDMCVCTRADKLVLNKKSCNAWIAIGKNLNNDSADGIVPSALLR